MKMLVVLHTGDDPRFVPDFLSSHGCSWTEFAGGAGQGRHHRHDGSRAFPGESMMTVSILDDARCQDIGTALREAAKALPDPDRLHVAIVPVEQFA